MLCKGSVNEYQLWLGRKRPVWLISVANWTCGCAGKTVWCLEITCHTWAPLRWWLRAPSYSTSSTVPETILGYFKFTYLYLCTYVRGVSARSERDSLLGDEVSENIVCSAPLPYLPGKTFYCLALRPPVVQMHISELTTRLQNPQVYTWDLGVHTNNGTTTTLHVRWLKPNLVNLWVPCSIY